MPRFVFKIKEMFSIYKCAYLWLSFIKSIFSLMCMHDVYVNTLFASRFCAFERMTTKGNIARYGPVLIQHCLKQLTPSTTTATALSKPLHQSSARSVYSKPKISMA